MAPLGIILTPGCWLVISDNLLLLSSSVEKYRKLGSCRYIPLVTFSTGWESDTTTSKRQAILLLVQTQVSDGNVAEFGDYDRQELSISWEKNNSGRVLRDQSGEVQLRSYHLRSCYGLRHHLCLDLTEHDCPPTKRGRELLLKTHPTDKRLSTWHHSGRKSPPPLTWSGVLKRFYFVLLELLIASTQGSPLVFKVGCKSYVLHPSSRWTLYLLV